MTGRGNGGGRGRKASSGQQGVLALEFVPDPGPDAVVVPLAEARDVAVEDGLPVRAPAAFRGQWSKPGWAYMASLDRLVEYESQFEAWTLLRLDFEGTLAQILPQPCRIHFGRQSRPLRHVPDYLVRHVSGERELVDVKGALAAESDENRLVFGLTATACEVLGWRYTVATEPAPAYYRNVRLLAGARHRRAGAVLDGHVETLVGFLAEDGNDHDPDSMTTTAPPAPPAGAPHTPGHVAIHSDAIVVTLTVGQQGSRVAARARATGAVTRSLGTAPAHIRHLSVPDDMMSAWFDFSRSGPRRPC